MRNILGKLLSAISWSRKSFALNNLDLGLLPYISFKKGFFVEAGANDGIKQSNTLYFEKYLGWTGLLVEPIPELAALCKKNRPKCIVENYALVPSGYKQDTITMRYCDLMSVVAGGMKTIEEENKHIERGKNIQNVGSYEVNVPTIPLSSILTKHNIETIDLLSLDVEGFELSVLQGIDFSIHRPRYILIEARYPKEINEHLMGMYDQVALLSHHDVLYKTRNNKV